MKIGYNKIWGVIFLLFTGMICCLAAGFSRMNKAFPPILVGSFWASLLLGILFLSRTYVEVKQTDVFIRPLLGFKPKAYHAHSVRDFLVEGKTVFIVNGGVRQKLPVFLWLADSRGWIAFLKWIEASNQQAG